MLPGIIRNLTMRRLKSKAGLHSGEGCASSRSHACVIVSRLMAKLKKKTAKKKSASTRKRSVAAYSKVAARAGAGHATAPARVRAILEKLNEAYPAVTCALRHDDPFQLLISTILS